MFYNDTKTLKRFRVWCYSISGQLGFNCKLILGNKLKLAARWWDNLLLRDQWSRRAKVDFFKTWTNDEAEFRFTLRIEHKKFLRTLDWEFGVNKYEDMRQRFCSSRTKIDSQPYILLHTSLHTSIQTLHTSITSLLFILFIFFSTTFMNPKYHSVLPTWCVGVPTILPVLTPSSIN